MRRIHIHPHPVSFNSQNVQNKTNDENFQIYFL